MIILQLTKQVHEYSDSEWRALRSKAVGEYYKKRLGKRKMSKRALARELGISHAQVIRMVR